MERIYTIGYEGAALADFIKTLKLSGVSVLLDIRELPISRRKGFSKQALAQAVRDAGIEYRHERSLGSPKELRDALHRDKNYDTFFREFDEYLQTQLALLKELADTLEGGVALMCYERNQNTCHRLIVAKHLQELTGLKPAHLGVRKYGNDNQTAIYLGQGLSAAQPAI